MKVCGLVISGLAISPEAPFWFDRLSKSVDLRGPGAKPATAASENRKDAAANAAAAATVAAASAAASAVNT